MQKEHFLVIIWEVRGWSGDTMVLGNLSVPGRPTIWITVAQGPTALAVGAGGGCLDICTLIYAFSPLSPSLLETARYRLKYCLKGPLNPKQPTNQSFGKSPVSVTSCSCGTKKLVTVSSARFAFISHFVDFFTASLSCLL